MIQAESQRRGSSITWVLNFPNLKGLCVEMITLPKIITVFDTETTGTGENAPVVS